MAGQTEVELTESDVSRGGSVENHLEQGLGSWPLSSGGEPLWSPSARRGSDTTSVSLESPVDALPNGRRARLQRRSSAETAAMVDLRTLRLQRLEVGRIAMASISGPQLIIGRVITVMAVALVPTLFLQVPRKPWCDSYTRVAGLVVSAAASVWTQALAHDSFSWTVALCAFANFIVGWAKCVEVGIRFFGRDKLGVDFVHVVATPAMVACIALLMKLTRDSVTAVGTAIGLTSGRLLTILIRTFYAACCGSVLLILDKMWGDEIIRFKICFGVALWIGCFSYVSWIVLAMLVLRDGMLLACEAADGNNGRQGEECRLAARTIKLEIYASSIAACFNILHALMFGIGLGVLWPVPALDVVLGDTVCFSLITLGSVTGNALVALHLGGLTGSVRASRLRVAKEQARQRTWTEASDKAVKALEAPRRMCAEDSSQTVGVVSPWVDKVRELSMRGVTLKALLDFYRGLGEQYMEHFDPSHHRTVDVVRHAVIPLSSASGCALASVMMKHEPTKPHKMVTHNWGNLFRDLVAAIIADALEEEEFDRISDLLQLRDIDLLEAWCAAAGKLHTAYWVCAFSVNQHSTICGQNPRGCRDSVTGELYPLCKCGVPKVSNTSEPTNLDGESIECEVNKFDDMMKLLSISDPDFEQVVAIDHEFNLFTRSWCVAELAAASEMGMRQKLKFSSEEELNEEEDQLRQLRIQDMEASRPEDKALILAKIEDVHAFNKKLQRLLFEDLLPAWGDLDAVAQIHRLARIARWQHLERTRTGTASTLLTSAFLSSSWRGGLRSAP